MEENQCVKRSTAEKILCILFTVLLCVTFILIGIVIFFATNRADQNEASGICTTAACAKAASRILTAADFSIKPCDNFYEFACGKWMERNIVPEDKSYHATFTILRDEVQIIIKELLENNRTEDDIESVSKAINLYKSCMNTELIDKRDISVLFPVLEELGGWPVLGNSTGGRLTFDDYSLNELLGRLMRYYNSPLISMYVYQDYKQSNRNIIYMDQASLILPSRDYYTKGKDDIVIRALTKVITTFCNLIGLHTDDVRQDVSDMIDFEIGLSKILTPREQRRDYEKRYNPFKVGDLNKEFGISLKHNFSLEGYLRETFSMKGVEIDLNDDDTVIIHDMNYTSQFIDFLDTYPPRTVANYVILRFLRNRLNNLPERFTDLILEISKLTDGRTISKPRWKKCSSLVTSYIGLAVGRLFVKDNFAPDAKLGMSTMIRYINESFNDILNELDWMGADTMTAAEEKIEFMDVKIGYDEDILDDELLDRRYENPLTEHMLLRHKKRVSRNFYVKTSLRTTCVSNMHVGGPECRLGTFGDECEFDCYNCQNDARCTAEKDGCICTTGWIGPICNDTCPKGHFGDGCNALCTCQNGGSCDAVSGVCICPPGVKGDNCEDGCPPGYYKENCDQKCPTHCPNGFCNRIFGFCECAVGFFGPSCNHPCPEWTYGANCLEQCTCHHENTETCDNKIGKCICKPGLHGKNCDQKCEDGFYGRQCQKQCNCPTSFKCDHVTGTCLYNCPAGWIGARCDQSCPKGKYGKHCKHSCDCRGSPCNPETGHCVCEAGKRGKHCKHKCHPGSWGVNCMKKCRCQNDAKCDAETGECICADGWFGRECEEVCPQGRFGAQCLSRCQCENKAYCDPMNGKCNCTAGWQGQTCDRGCKEGHFGANCDQGCQCENGAFCHIVTGACTCKDGYIGPTCNESCPSGRYGPNCGLTCNCQNKGSCDTRTGQCICPPGYNGNKCQNMCVNGRYGINCTGICRCSENSHCDHVTGRCNCNLGWMGESCDQMCPQGRFGPGCIHTCNCRNKATCDPISGCCGCSSGFYGQSCELECPVGSHGPYCSEECDCVNGWKCNAMTGQCKCPLGFVGDQCETQCKRGTFGRHCREACDCGEAECDHMTGNCICPSGSTGPDCRKACSKGRFGPNCEYFCDCDNEGTCDPSSGSCICQDGFIGPKCEYNAVPDGPIRGDIPWALLYYNGGNGKK